MPERYTPTTAQVREQYTREQPPQIGTVSERTAEFDRWLDRALAGARREGQAEAWGEGEADGRHNAIEHRPGMKFTNPYEGVRHVDQ